MSENTRITDHDQNIPPRSNQSSKFPTSEHGFSDIINGEELEFRKEHDDDQFPVIHKIEALGHITPPNIFSKCSTNQLITIAGAASGFLAGVVVCPLDVIKTKLQAQGSHGKKLNFRQTLKSILRDEGIKGLYRGLVPITIGYLPTWTIYFTVYERAKKFYPGYLSKHWDINSPSLNHFCAAITAGMVSSIAVNPIWVVKTRLMVQTNKSSPNEVRYKGTIDAFKKMYNEEGIRVFYSGLIPSIFGLLHVGIHFPAYEYLKSLLHCKTIDQQHEVHGLLWRLIAASSISKMIASTITYPHEILRTRMQIRQKKHKSTDKEPSTTSNKKLSLIRTMKDIFHKEGVRGFYAGYFTNLLRTVPASAVTLVSFEYFKTYLLDISGKTRRLNNA
ncbi:uncharacterized protein KGF55_001557 [Candida pseudojiufengensis]|uniref:uncharacterized protein n=1 Tax=Candida pseudojiufengensis TaxID=497109 RepID=UPI002224689E|nr:uncharacterized protein KGF55_001557 [Candida pseudojiufengensis]KAI5965336.1 hypothetical protein KGF55_001557 [Candida pseudojiufengensis]